MSTKSALQSILEGILSSEERIKDAHNSLPEEMQVNNTTTIKNKLANIIQQWLLMLIIPNKERQSNSLD